MFITYKQVINYTKWFVSLRTVSEEEVEGETMTYDYSKPWS